MFTSHLVQSTLFLFFSQYVHITLCRINTGFYSPLSMFTSHCVELTLFLFFSQYVHITLQWRIQDFPRGAPTPKIAIIFHMFARKLHENERIWTLRGACVPGAPPTWIPPMHCVELTLFLLFPQDVHV